ncbi:NAD(P)-binding protein [Dissoconium aciculare CBS 342.82]|uniref:NAD(P)-binding protein n=1 Tax=Dissoconium aciculare CBS 342.82 TaxID=1314786 RepID=A0A6J3LVF3_9PEZI|nr:NAD(P)-binding protein [Dissoconium aciculare CBS 342.82]KAF1819741.1 NAD(P)-binding protein [Dissoconium aciculare CBS 342.82]
MALNTLIFGGSGKCARHITKLLSSQGHTVHSVIRNPDQKSDIEQLGGKPIVQSIEDSSVDDMVQTIKSTNATAVLWCAGAGGGNPERTKAVDNEGAIRSMDATAEAGVKRYIIISALDVRDKANASTEPDWYNDADRKRSDGVWKVIKPYMEAKFAADRSLASENGRRKLDYTIVRPGGLTNDPAKGAIEAGKVHLHNQISREDVAAVVVECLKRDDTIGLAFDCVGGETPVAEAVAKVGAEKINTFEGRY